MKQQKEVPGKATRKHKIQQRRLFLEKDKAIHSVLYGFMDKVGDDHRIGPTHISLFLAVLYFCRKQGYAMPIYVYRKELMKQAKISAVGTYHKVMSELKTFGYIGYIPSYNPALGSLVYLSEM